ncbi:MAG TPA: trimeric intracellular cation channel family protein [Verrucomicrobiota bacterium]|jgi:uncharacterized membrane protein YeiH|nr:trimeric intracellular cation channel family protein [Verrucomicrobiota bacterium]
MESSDLLLWLQKVLDAGLAFFFHWLTSLEQSLRHSPPLEHFGAITAAITGVLAARNKKIDIFGILVLGFVTGVGGGTIRDICLNVQVWWVAQPSFTVSIVITCFLTFFITRITHLPRRLLDVADAFALAFFTVIGSWKAIEYDAGIVNTVMMGVITGVAGGMLRDVFLGTIPSVFRQGIYLYATASAAGAILYVCSDIWNLPYKWSLSIGVILLLRIGAIHWKLTLPEYHSDDEEDQNQAQGAAAPVPLPPVIPAVETATAAKPSVSVESAPEMTPPEKKNDRD